MSDLILPPGVSVDPPANEDPTAQAEFAGLLKATPTDLHRLKRSAERGYRKAARQLHDRPAHRPRKANKAATKAQSCRIQALFYDKLASLVKAKTTDKDLERTVGHALTVAEIRAAWHDATEEGAIRIPKGDG